jgi:hippurate hydrolase
MGMPSPVESLLRYMTDSRRFLHQIPEPAWEEVETAAWIREQLTAMEIPWRAVAGTGTVATLTPMTLRGPHLAFRADMDALPIQEATGLPFASRHQGKMHACGHDGHMAALLGTAKWFKQQEAELSGPVSFVFQPAEEGGHGALRMLEEGALEGVDEIYGWHNWPALPLGKALCPDGTVMSGNGTFKITVIGQGGHASQPEAARDPVLAASALILNLQQIVSRRLPPQAKVVLSVTSVDGRSSPTVIPGQVVLEGSFRFSESRWQAALVKHLTEISISTAASYGVSAEVEVFPRYGATINHPASAAGYRGALETEFGADFDQSELLLPIMASEDFSYYLKQLPGAFALIGISEESEPRFSAPCHSPQYLFNDKVLPHVVSIFSRLAGITVPDILPN